MNKTLRVARHEFRVTAANKAFVIITILGPFLILAVTVLPTFLARSGSAMPAITLALSGGEDLRPALEASLAARNSRVVSLPTDPAEAEAQARSGIMSGDYAAALILGPDWASQKSVRLLTKTGTDMALYGLLESALGDAARRANAVANGLDPAVVQRVLESPTLAIQKLGKDEGSTGALDQYLGVLFTALAFVMMLYMTVLLYGQLIGRSVLQEKTAKTVEIMLSSVSARQLMAGKILGPGLAGLIQYGVWVGFGLVGIKVLGPALHVALPSVLSASSLGWLVVFFLPAYFLYASIYAALGAGAEDEQHLAQLAWPVIIFLIIPVVLISYLLTNPGSGLSVFCSFFPLTSPIVMLIRVLVSPPPAWQIALSLAILAATVWGMAILAGKVFRVGILMTGKRRKLGEIIRWARQA
jgi:ABC-2 type transport system permease protein